MQKGKQRTRQKLKSEARLFFYHPPPPLLSLCAHVSVLPPPPLHCSLVTDTSPPFLSPTSQLAGSGGQGRLMSFWLRTGQRNATQSSLTSWRRRSQNSTGNRRAAFKMTNQQKNRGNLLLYNLLQIQTNTNFQHTQIQFSYITHCFKGLLLFTTYFQIECTKPLYFTASYMF